MSAIHSRRKAAAWKRVRAPVRTLEMPMRPPYTCDRQRLTSKRASATTLAHAPSPQRRARTLFFSALWICAVLAISYGSWRCIQRVYQINRDPHIGPVDLALVLQEPSLWRAAWRLLWNPDSASLPEWWQVGTTTVACTPLRPYIGSERGDVSISVRTPLRYVESRLRVDIVVKNTGSHPVAVPAVRGRPWTGLTAIAGQRSGWLRDVVPESAGWLSLGVVTWGGCLAKGARLLRAGEALTITIEGSAPTRPCTLLIFVPLYGGWEELLVEIPVDETGNSRWQRWSDVPAEAIRSRRFFCAPG